MLTENSQLSSSVTFEIVNRCSNPFLQVLTLNMSASGTGRPALYQVTVLDFDNVTTRSMVSFSTVLMSSSSLIKLQRTSASSFYKKTAILFFQKAFCVFQEFKKIDHLIAGPT